MSDTKYHFGWHAREQRNINGRTRKNRLWSIFPALLLVFTVCGCAPIIKPAIPPTPIAPTATAPSPYKRVALNDFMPDLAVLIPITFEIPTDYVLFTPDAGSLSHYALPPKNAEIFRTSQVKPRDIAFLELKFSTHVGYDSQTDKFMGLPNSMSDTSLIQEYISQVKGAKITNIERIKIGEYPALIMELESPYADTNLNRKINFVYVATLVDTNTVLLVYYYSLPPTPAQDDLVWKHFRDSFERTPGVSPVPLVPYSTYVPTP